MSNPKHQCIHCHVASCCHQDANKCECALESIEVRPRRGACSGCADEESMCGSYAAR